MSSSRRCDSRLSPLPAQPPAGALRAAEQGHCALCWAFGSHGLETGSFGRWQPAKRHHGCIHPKSLIWSGSRHTLALGRALPPPETCRSIFRARSFCSAAADHLKFICPQQTLFVRANSDFHEALSAGPTRAEEGRVIWPFNATPAFTYCPGLVTR